VSNEAPKKIWVDAEFDVYDYEEQGSRAYIRADLVDGLVEALKDMATIAECSGNLARNARAALKALEEE